MDGLLSGLPSRDAAATLAHTYYRNGAWMYGCLPREVFFASFLPHVYPGPHEPEHDISSQKLAVVFYVLALGGLFDLYLPPRESSLGHPT